MPKIQFELTSTLITSHAGLAFIGQALADPVLADDINGLCSLPRNKNYISTLDTIKAMIGLLSVGKPQFDAIAEYRADPVFATALGIKKTPSPETLRQRIEQCPESLNKVFREFNTRLLAAHPDLLNEELHGQTWAVIHCDVSPMDNSNSRKEGVSWTYKQFEGYAPMLGYIGPYGLMINNELRDGSAHSNTAGTDVWFKQTMDMAERVTSHKRLLVTDSGNDSGVNVRLFMRQKDTDFVVKCNLRNQDLQEWLDLAVQQNGGADGEYVDIGARAWYGQKEVQIPGHSDTPDDPKTCRIVFRVTKRFARTDGQYMFPAMITVDAYWTSLDWTPEQIHEFYKQRGTSEQYHSELKTDMDVERLPSGKFRVNQHVLDMSMIAFNLLRLAGQGMLKTGLVPGRKARSKRLRLRTVIQNLMYMAGRLVQHARKTIIRIFEGHGWAEPVMALNRLPDG